MRGSIISAIILLLTSLSGFGQTWFDYRPSGVPGWSLEQGGHMHTSSTVTFYQGTWWLETSITFIPDHVSGVGYVGGGGGEWWVFFDLNTGLNNPVPAVSTPKLMDLSDLPIDGDLFTAWSSQATPVTPQALEVFWGVGQIWIIHTASIVPRPAQLGGSSFVIDIHFWQPQTITIARLELPFNLPVYFTSMDIHVIGNLDTELDGAGWVYLYETIDL